MGNCRVGYCLSGIVSWWENAVVGICPCGKLSSGKLTNGKLSEWDPVNNVAPWCYIKDLISSVFKKVF